VFLSAQRKQLKTKRILSRKSRQWAQEPKPLSECSTETRLKIGFGPKNEQICVPGPHVGGHAVIAEDLRSQIEAETLEQSKNDDWNRNEKNSGEEFRQHDWKIDAGGRGKRGVNTQIWQQHHTSSK
jgi:hypothetical protein